MALLVDLDERGEALWREVSAAWEDQGVHDRFVHHCYAVGRLPAAGARYRTMLNSEPPPSEGAAAIARRMQQRVVFLSLQSLEKPSPRAGRSTFLRSPWLLVVVLLGAALGAALGFLYGGRR